MPRDFVLSKTVIQVTVWGMLLTAADPHVRVPAAGHTLLHMLLLLAPDTITHARTSRACVWGDKNRSLAAYMFCSMCGCPFLK